MLDLQNSLEVFHDQAPADAVDGSGQFRFGRYREPVAQPDFRGAEVSDYPALWGRARPTGLGALVRGWRLKEWHYHSIVNDRWFLAVCAAQLGYLCNVFAYLVDRQTGQKSEYTILSPLGRGLTFAESSVSGRTRWQRGTESLAFSFDPARGAWTADIHLPVGGRLLSGSFTVEADQALALLFPLHRNRAGYTHKQAGNAASGRVTFGDEIVFEPGASFGTMDWTRSFANRRTMWNWLCVAGRAATGERLGLNLSARVYEHRENCLWVDGLAFPLGPVRFQVPPQPAVNRQPWKIQGDSLDLTFEPVGDRQENVKLGLIASQFVQMYGTISGSVERDGRRLELHRLFGVAEDHFALW